MYRAPEAFWLLQFACESDDYEVYRPYFVSWAQSVNLCRSIICRQRGYAGRLRGSCRLPPF